MSGLAELAFAVAALAFVLTLAWFALRLLARYGVGTGRGPTGRRVRLVQSVSVGHRERLLLVRCDDREYLLLSTPHAATVVDRLGEIAPAGPETGGEASPEREIDSNIAPWKPPGKTL